MALSVQKQLVWGPLTTFEPVRLRKGAYFAEAGRVDASTAYVAAGVLRAFHRTPNGLKYNKAFFVTDEFLEAFSSLGTG